MKAKIAHYSFSNIHVDTTVLSLVFIYESHPTYHSSNEKTMSLCGDGLLQNLTFDQQIKDSQEPQVSSL